DVFNQFNSEWLKNGFRKCGLYPLDVNAVDFSNCITQPATDSCPQSNPEVVEFVQALELLIETEKIEEFRRHAGAEWSGDVSYSALYSVWIRAKHENLLSVSLS